MGVWWVFSTLLVAAWWVCGCFAQTQAEAAALAVSKGPFDKTSCAEIMDILERKLYTSYRPNLPIQALEKTVPILVASLLPLKCLESGSDATTMTQPQQDLAFAQRLSRPKRNIFSLFMGGGLTPGQKIKDPGDHPPPGMKHNPFKDPGDRPMTLFGVTIPKVKDPGDRPPPPPGEAAPVNPMMSMLRWMALSRMFSLMANGGRHGGGGGGGGRGARGPSQG